MGNHYGTVRCSVCYERGHNKRSCPRFTKRLEDRLSTYQGYIADAAHTDIDISNYQRQSERLAAQIAKRTGVNPLSGEKLVKRGPTRRCSYCKAKHGSWGEEGLGHTRRTCRDLKADIQTAQERTASMREMVLKDMRANGIGVGALLSQRVSGYFPDPKNPGESQWDRREVVCIVTKVMWDKISIYNPRGAVLLAQRMDKVGTTMYETFALPYVLDSDGDVIRLNGNGEMTTARGSTLGAWYVDAPAEKDDYERRRLVSPVSADKINAPSNWFLGESPNIAEHFKGMKS
jgi:hypothetical protein